MSIGDIVMTVLAVCAITVTVIASLLLPFVIVGMTYKMFKDSWKKNLKK